MISNPGLEKKKAQRQVPVIILISLIIYQNMRLFRICVTIEVQNFIGGQYVGTHVA